MQPVPSSIVKRRNLLGLRSREVIQPSVSARERGRGVALREKSDESDGRGVRVLKSKARSFTWVLIRVSSMVDGEVGK